MNTLVAQWFIGARGAEELLFHVPLDVFEMVGYCGLHGLGGSGTGGKMPLSEPSDHGGDMVDVGDGKGKGNVFR